MNKPLVKLRYFSGRDSYAQYYAEAHADGALDAKTKSLMHLAVVLALKCEPCAVSTFDNARRLGATEEEIDETVQLAGSVGAGAILAMAGRAREAADSKHYWWRPKTQDAM